MLEEYEEAVVQHQDMVYSFALYYLGNRQEAEDVTQDVLLKLWEHWAELDRPAVPRWLNRVTRNASYDLLRRRRTRHRFVVDDTEGRLVGLAEANEPGPQRVIEQSALRDRVRSAVAELPEPYRSAMILREIRELSYAEVGEVLEIPVNTAKTHVHRGRRLLRKTLLEEAHV